MRYPCRCNRRNCQARRSLAKRPELYRKWPTCPCGGKLYVDWYRFHKGKHDQPPRCRSSACILSWFPHHVATAECYGNAAYLAERNAAPRSKHSPIPAVEWVPF